MRWLLMLAGLILLPATGAPAPGGSGAPDVPACGTAPGDWCAPPPDDPCGQHADVAACRADPQCYGMPYRGESLVACRVDERGFGINCPTVGCTAVPPGGPDAEPQPE
jgi:hypothetical protein